MKIKREPKKENWKSGSEYVPYLQTHQARGVKSIKIRAYNADLGRVQHFLSQPEFWTFLLFRWNANLSDVREQFALDPKRTQEIALELGVKHPMVPVTNEISVVTTDLLVTLSNGRTIAIAVKHSTALKNKRVLEKLEIERTYWRERGVNWHIITEKEISPLRIRNLRFILNGPNPGLPEETEKVAREIILSLLKEGVSLAEAGKTADRILKLSRGQGINVARKALRERRWKVDLDVPIDPLRPLEVQV